MENNGKNLLLLYIGIVVFIHVIPVSESVAPDQFNMVAIRPDQFIHLILFVPFCILVRSAFDINVYSHKILSLFILFALLAFSFIMEYMQIFIPYRSFELGDLVANLMGVLLGAAALCVKMD